MLSSIWRFSSNIKNWKIFNCCKRKKSYGNIITINNKKKLQDVMKDIMRDVIKNIMMFRI